MKVIVTERPEYSGKLYTDRNPLESELIRRAGALFPDPIDEDTPIDEIVVTIGRAIGRVVLVATETALLFQREAVRHDPIAWMFAPRAVFGGAAAVDACLLRDTCVRGILVQGLCLGLDVERSAVDALLASDDDDDFDEHEFRSLHGERLKWRRKPVGKKPGRATRVKDGLRAANTAGMRTRGARFGDERLPTRISSMNSSGSRPTSKRPAFGRNRSVPRSIASRHAIASSDPPLLIITGMKGW